jgi:hypothetical protein
LQRGSPSSLYDLLLIFSISLGRLPCRTFDLTVFSTGDGDRKKNSRKSEIFFSSLLFTPTALDITNKVFQALFVMKTQRRRKKNYKKL